MTTQNDNTGFVAAGNLVVVGSAGLGIGGVGASTARLTLLGLGAANPNASGLTQSAGHLMRLIDGVNIAVLDIGGYQGNGYWLQVANQANLAQNYPLLLNPNGGGVGINVLPTAFPAGVAFQVIGKQNFDGIALGGDYYNHALITIGRNYNTLTQLHQVSVYTNLSANSAASGAGSWLCGFETGMGVNAGVALERACHFDAASLSLGVGATITRVIGLDIVDEVVGANNVAIVDDASSSSFTGNWFIYYGGTRASRLGGSLGVGGNPLFPLHVINSAIQLVAEFDATHRAALWHDGTTGHVGTTTNQQFTVRTNNTDAITVDASQNVTVAGTVSERGRTTPMGQWITFTPALAASAGTFSGGTVTTASYTLVGKTLTVNFVLTGYSVSATPNNLQMTLPGSFTAQKQAEFLFNFSDNGTAGVGTAQLASGGTTVFFFKNLNGSTNWATSVTNTKISGSLTFEIV